MKLYFIVVAMLACKLNFAQEGGIRPYTAAELKRWETVCSRISTPLPKNFKDYTAEHTSCGGFEWSERDTKGNPLTVVNNKNEPTGNQPYYIITFKMNEDVADSLSKVIDMEMLKAVKPDNTFDAKTMETHSNHESKLNQCKSPAIAIAINKNVTISKTYAAGTQPIKLDLPIIAFAYLYTVPDGRSMGNDNDVVAYDNMNQYQDKALIIISTKPPKVVSTKIPANASVKEDNITPVDGTEESCVPVKNIVVEINGFEKDVRALINQINWKALQAVINQ